MFMIWLGGAILAHFNNSTALMLQNVYPKCQWQVWRFAPVSRRVLDNRKHQHDMLTWLTGQLNISHWEQWYQVTYKEIVRKGGFPLLHYYNYSPATMLMTILPYYPWVQWKFPQVPREYWDDKTNQLRTLEVVAKKLNIKHWEDWYVRTLAYSYVLAPVTLQRYHKHSIPYHYYHHFTLTLIVIYHPVFFFRLCF